MDTLDKLGNVLEIGDLVSCLYGKMIIGKIGDNVEITNAFGHPLLMLLRPYNKDLTEIMNPNEVKLITTKE